MEREKVVVPTPYARGAEDDDDEGRDGVVVMRGATSGESDHIVRHRHELAVELEGRTPMVAAIAEAAERQGAKLPQEPSLAVSTEDSTARDT